jgi:hypothetical protein
VSGSARSPCQRKRKVPIGGAHLSMEEERAADTLSGKRDSGPGLAFGTGLNGIPLALFLFLFSFSFFLFSVLFHIFF